MKNILITIKKYGVFLYIPTLLYLSTQLYYFLLNQDFKKMIYLPTHLFGLTILITVFLLTTCILGNTKITTNVLSIILLIFMIINQLKISYAQDPVMFSDIFFLQDTQSILDITGSTMAIMLIQLIPWTLVYIIALICINFVSFKTRFNICTYKKRVLFLIPCIIYLFVIYFPNDNVTVFMQNKVFDKVTNAKNNQTTTNIAYYQKHGIISGMYGLLLSNRFIEPKNYKSLVNNLDNIMESNSTKYTDYVNKNCTSWGTPNIIMIFSESFWDLDKLDEVSFDKPITSNLHKLMNTGIYAEMISPTFGGISANIEYQVLTGSNLSFFCEGYIPYMQLLTNSNYNNAPYVSNVLKSNNYKTQLTSTWKSTLYNCSRAYDYMDIDVTKYDIDFDNPTKKGGRISEKAVVDEIIDALESKDDNTKLFHMDLTAQTHMPYYKERYKDEEYDIKITSSPLSSTENEMLLCYAQGVYDADKQLGRLYDYIQDYDEPTIIVFYGDHLPYLNNSSGEDIYNDLEYFNTDNYLLNYFRKYNTQLLITGNFDLGEDDINYIGPDLIMPYIFSRCDLKHPSTYYNYLASTIETLPAINYFVAVDQNGNLYSPQDLPKNMNSVYNIRQCINWREFIAIK